MWEPASCRAFAPCRAQSCLLIPVSQDRLRTRWSDWQLVIRGGDQIVTPNVASGSRAEVLTSSRCGPLFLRQPNSYCIRAEVRSRANCGPSRPPSAHMREGYSLSMKLMPYLGGATISNGACT